MSENYNLEPEALPLCCHFCGYVYEEGTSKPHPECLPAVPDYDKPECYEEECC